MTERNVKIAKMDRNLFDEFSKIAHMRVINHKDKKYSPPTVQRKTLNHPLWAKLREDLINADFIDDNSQMRNKNRRYS